MCKLSHNIGASSGEEAARGELQAKVASAARDPAATDLGHLRADAGSFERLPPGEFTFVSKVATGIHGDVLRYRWAWLGAGGRGEVAVKKLRNTSLEQLRGTERDERKVHLGLSDLPAPCQEDALTEIGVLQRLASQAEAPLYLLRMLGVFSDSDSVWLVTEMANGGELFNEVSERGPLPEAEARRYSWELLQAVAYLHRHHIGHRDISLENVLLKEGSIRLMDFGMAVQSHSASSGAPLRYFRSTGKDFYRAPECYVPMDRMVTVTTPAVRPESGIVTARVRDTYLCEVLLPSAAVPGRLSSAQPVGYTVPPADMFAVGVCIFIMMYATPPWAQAVLGDSRFAYVNSRSLTDLVVQWGLRSPAPEIRDLLNSMTSSDPSSRRAAEAYLESSWFADLRDTAVPCHPKDLTGEPMMLRGLAGA